MYTLSFSCGNPHCYDPDASTNSDFFGGIQIKAAFEVYNPLKRPNFLAKMCLLL